MATVLTLVGSNSGISGLSDGVGGQARLSYPFGISACGRRVFIAEYGNHAIRVLERGGKLRTLAGGTKPGLLDGKGSEACFNQPTGVAVDPSTGTIYVADSHNNAIRQITPDGVVSTLVGANGDAGFVDGPAREARFNKPYSLAWVKSTQELVVTDRYNHAVRLVTLKGAVSTLSGTGKSGPAENTTASLATFNEPQAVTVDDRGQIYIADTNNHVIRKIDVDRQVVTVAGTGVEGSCDSNSAQSAQFSLPRGIELDARGNIFVGDSGNHVIRKITEKGVVTTIAGRGEASTKGTIDGLGKKAGFYWPRSIAMDVSGTFMFVADSFNERIRQVGCTDAIWSKKTHPLFPPANKLVVHTVMATVFRLGNLHRNRLPNLPIETWLCILTFLSVDDWNGIDYWKWKQYSFEPR